MKKFLIALAIILTAGQSIAQTTKIMTYNIRLDTDSDRENRWDVRKELLAGQIKFYEPDFLGVQEALPQQMKYLDGALTSYQHIGVGRDDGKDKGEHSAIFFNKDRFKLINDNTFWLSQTPDKPGLGWDAAYNRVCTYGLFENKKTKQRLWVFNTHFDHVGDVARVESAKLIMQKIKEVNKDNLPYVVTGDFNLEDTTQPIKIMSGYMNDSKAVAELTYGPDGTWNAFEFNKPATSRIDYIFTSHQKIKIKKYAVLSDNKNCHYFSDHLAVLAEIQL